MSQENLPAAVRENTDVVLNANIPQTLSLGMVANTVESFSGRERVTEYFEKIRLRARLDNWDEKTTVDIVKFRLTGEAYRFLKTDPAFEDPTLSFTDFEDKFIKRFSPIKIPGEALMKLSRCFQRHDESVSDYVGRLKILGAEILREDTATSQAFEIAGLKKKCNELVLHQFKAGLKKEYMRNIGTLLMRTAGLTIDQAENFARQEELNSLMLTNRQNSGSILAVKCFKCGKFNHYANECRNRPHFNGNSNQANPNNYGGRQNYQFSGNFRQPRQPHPNFNHHNFGHHFDRSQQQPGPSNNYVNRSRPNNVNANQFARRDDYANQTFNRQPPPNQNFQSSSQNSVSKTVASLNWNNPSIAPQTGGN